jgi:putative ABC transport system permease protein
MPHALRRLLASPGFTLTALLTLALGIGLNTSMFSVLNALFLRSLPYAQPDSLLRVYRTAPQGQQLPHSPANFTDLRAQTHSFAQMAAVSGANFSLALPDQPALRLRGQVVTADFFPALGMSPLLGRTFTPEEDSPGKNGVVVLSHTVWQNRFGADPAIVGRSVRLDSESVTVIGVMPREFDDTLLWGPVEAWRPMAWSAETIRNRGGNWLTVIARLKPGVTLAAAQAESATVAAQLAVAYPVTSAQTGVSLMPLLQSAEDPTIRRVTWFTFGLAACVLLIACANLANLQFARHAARAREQAVRAALGASRFRLIRDSLNESLLLAFAGGALGLLVALWSNDALGARIALNGGTSLALPLDLPTFAFAFGAAAFTGIAFGLLPAWLASRADLNDSLRQGSRGAAGGRTQQRIRQALIVGEVALALVLLSGAGFFLRGLERFSGRDVGWRTDRLLTANLTLTGTKYGSADAQRAFHDRLESRLAALPGVERVALAASQPFFSYDWNQRFIVEGRTDPKPGTEPQRSVNVVSLGYFDTLGVKLVAGRTFTAADGVADAPTRTIINETMAQQLWPDESAVGKRIAHPSDRAWQEIIGVVRDVRFAANINDAKPRLQTYRLHAREPGRSFAVLLRSTTPPEALAETLRKVVAELDPDLPAQDIRPAAQTIERGLANFTTLGRLLAGFAALGLLLAALGIYGVVAGSVVQRTREIGIRLALGAQIRDVLRLVLGQGLALALIGSAFGLLGAFAVARLLTATLPALPPPEWSTTALVTGTLLAVAALACWIPARRATKVDPMTSLRAE